MTVSNAPPPSQRSCLTGIAYTRPELREKAVLLATRLGMPLATEKKTYDFLLTCTKKGLELFYTGDPSLTGSFRVDFTAGAAGFRRKARSVLC